MSAGPSTPLLAFHALPAALSGGVGTVLLVAFLVVSVSFLASMTEAAFLSLPRLKAVAMKESTSRLDRLAGKMRLAFARPLATIVILNNLANVSGSALFGLAVANWLTDDAAAASGAVQTSTGVWIASTILTFVVIVVGEIIPKTIGERYSGTVIRMMAPMVRGLTTVLFPIVYLVGLAQKPFVHVGARHVTSEEEIAHLTELGQEQGAIEHDEGKMIQRIFRLNDLTAEDIMTPRVEIVGLAAEKTLAGLADELGVITRSRIPLFGENRDDIVGVLDRSNALLALARGQSELLATDESVSFQPLFVPLTMPADDLMITLQRRTAPIAIVVGEYGETIGLVTLEDVIEEIVGEIVDEGDLAATEDITRIGDDEIVCDARIEVNDINEALGTEIPNHRTVAGLLLDELEHIPATGTQLTAHGVRFTVEDANDRAVLSVRVKRLPQGSTEGDVFEATD